MVALRPMGKQVFRSHSNAAVTRVLSQPRAGKVPDGVAVLRWRVAMGSKGCGNMSYRRGTLPHYE
jgi:hypothetical protein